MSLPKMVGSDGKTPAIVYRDGAPLLGLEELYKASKRAEGEEPVLVEVIIPPDFMSKENKRVKARQLWGDTLYTPDSDIVAVLMHMGYYAHYLAHPPAMVSGFHAVLQLLPPQEKYPSKSRFVKSRAWSSGGGAGGEGCSLKVERAWLVTRSGTTIELQPCVDEVPAPYPTIQPGGNERQITTRTTGAKSSKVSQEVPVQFNLVNEPWLKYTLPAIADKGLKPSQWTSARLLDEVLFLESNTLRYQLSFAEVVESDGGVRKALYTFSLCKTPLPVALMYKQGVPLPSSMLTTLAEGVEWEEFKWGVTTLHLRGQEYLLKRMHFMPTAKPTEDLMET